jgi:hypothetical protein
VSRLSSRLRRWLVGVVVAAVVLEVVYVVASHLLLRGDALSRLINKKPEKFRIEWTSARSYLPGLVAIERLTIRGQSRKVQWYLAADDVRGRIGLLRLALKTVHVRSTSAAGLDFRLRRRLDPPADEGEGAEGAQKEIRGSEHFPEIPGLANPPDPRPEDLYSPPGHAQAAVGHRPRRHRGRGAGPGRGQSLPTRRGRLRVRGDGLPHA